MHVSLLKPIWIYVNDRHLLRQRLHQHQPESKVDCASIIPCSSEKLLSGDYYGELNEADHTGVWNLLETTETLTTKQKKRYGIRRR